MMKLNEIAEISRIMAKFGITEFNVKEGDSKIQLKRERAPAPPMPMPMHMPMPMPMHMQQMHMNNGVAPVVVAEVPVTPPVSVVKAETIDSPIVGTFYTSPGPDQPTFVKVGDVVDADKVICIIEAMKVMNEIKAGKSGKIVKIIATDSKAVEFGEPLFEIVQ